MLKESSHTALHQILRYSIRSLSAYSRSLVAPTCTHTSTNCHLPKPPSPVHSRISCCCRSNSRSLHTHLSTLLCPWFCPQTNTQMHTHATGAGFCAAIFTSAFCRSSQPVPVSQQNPAHSVGSYFPTITAVSALCLDTVQGVRGNSPHLRSSRRSCMVSLRRALTCANLPRALHHAQLCIWPRRRTALTTAPRVD